MSFTLLNANRLVNSAFYDRVEVIILLLLISAVLGKKVYAFLDSLLFFKNCFKKLFLHKFFFRKGYIFLAYTYTYISNTHLSYCRYLFAHGVLSILFLF